MVINDTDLVKFHIDYKSMGRDFEIEMIVIGNDKGGFYVWHN